MQLQAEEYCARSMQLAAGKVAEGSSVDVIEGSWGGSVEELLRGLQPLRFFN